uniref:Uncharacterized protein n=1 Tax=Nelumbo nucifera TaxID=4432 RepID=A0A822ZEX7_NELNU|nr:TPA_asm: hypothetical protein HUJ06_015869 [Nelumbo nucifera]
MNANGHHIGPSGLYSTLNGNDAECQILRLHVLGQDSGEASLPLVRVSLD